MNTKIRQKNRPGSSNGRPLSTTHDSIPERRTYPEYILVLYQLCHLLYAALRRVRKYGQCCQIAFWKEYSLKDTCISVDTHRLSQGLRTHVALSLRHNIGLSRRPVVRSARFVRSFFWYAVREYVIGTKTIYDLQRYPSICSFRDFKRVAKKLPMTTFCIARKISISPLLVS